MYNLRKEDLTLISGIATPTLEDKFLLTIVSLGINSFSMGPSLWKGENTWQNKQLQTSSVKREKHLTKIKKREKTEKHFTVS